MENSVIPKGAQGFSLASKTRDVSLVVEPRGLRPGLQQGFGINHACFGGFSCWRQGRGSDWLRAADQVSYTFVGGAAYLCSNTSLITAAHHHVRALLTKTNTTAPSLHEVQACTRFKLAQRKPVKQHEQLLALGLG